MRGLLCMALGLALASCSTGEGESEDASEAAEMQGETANAGGVSDAPETVEGVTPMAERVATIGLLNKRNNVSRDLEITPGEMVEEGPVRVSLSACERTAPWEMPQETGAFVQVSVQDRGSDDFEQIFSGWLFKNSPSLNVVEHPIYDVWVKDCAMAFPGDE